MISVPMSPSGPAPSIIMSKPAGLFEVGSSPPYSLKSLKWRFSPVEGGELKSEEESCNFEAI